MSGAHMIVATIAPRMLVPSAHFLEAIERSRSEGWHNGRPFHQKPVQRILVIEIAGYRPHIGARYVRSSRLEFHEVASWSARSRRFATSLQLAQPWCLAARTG